MGAAVAVRTGSASEGSTVIGVPVVMDVEFSIPGSLSGSSDEWSGAATLESPGVRTDEPDSSWCPADDGAGIGGGSEGG